MKNLRQKSVTAIGLLLLVALLLSLSGCGPKTGTKTGPKSDTQTDINSNPKDTPKTSTQDPESSNQTSAQNPEPDSTNSDDQDQVGRLTLQEATTEEIDEYANDIYKMNHAVPEILAATVSAFPQALADCELESTDAMDLDYTMSWAENGGEVQRQLLEKLKAILEHAQIQLYHYSGPMTQYCIQRTDSDAEPTAENVELYTESGVVQGCQILAVTMAYEDGSDTGYFNIENAYLRVELDPENIIIE